MAYTNTWNEANPLGSTDAALIDDRFRDLKVDIRERLNSLIGVAIGTALADPAVATPNNLAKLTTLSPLADSQTFKLSLGCEAGFGNYTSVGLSTVPPLDTNGFFATNGTFNGYVFYWPVVLPVGVTITLVTLNHNVAAANSFVLTLRKRAKTTATWTNIYASAATNGSAAIANTDSSAQTEVTVADTYYQVKVADTVVAGSDIYHGIQITYTSPTANYRI